MISERKQVWATFAQLNVPVFGDANALPLLRKLDLEGSWRHDQYSDVGGTSNPKVAFNWTLSEDLGLTVRGSWGTSFRAPSFAEVSGLVKDAIAGWNTTLFAQNTTIALNCGPAAELLAGRLTNPGSGFVGWNGSGSNGGTPGVSCGAGAQPVGLALLGASGPAINAGLRSFINTQNKNLHPENSMNWGIGGEFAPQAFLKLKFALEFPRKANCLNRLGRKSFCDLIRLLLRRSGS